MNNIAIVVVLYGKELIDSKTIMSMVDFEINFYSLTIYNNGPVTLSDDDSIFNKLKDKFKSIRVINDLNNSPLSKIYNKFLTEVESFSYIIMDDDTELNTSYIEMLGRNALNPKYDIIIPKILSKDGQQYYPISNGIPVSSEGVVSDLPNILSISSGIVINETAFSKLSLTNKCIFDERYALYGIDTSFFKNITKNKKVSIAVESYLLHSLSRAEFSDSPFRRKERLLDLAISTRCYPSPFNFYYFIKTFLKLNIAGDFNLALLLVRVFLKGKHPKC